MEMEEVESFASSQQMDMDCIDVGTDYGADKPNFLWFLREFPGRIGIVHVHQPSKFIPLLGANVPEKFANAAAKSLHRKRETERMLELLSSYVKLCHGREVSVHYIISEDKLLGLQQLVVRNQIRRLVISSRAMSKENGLLQFCQLLLVRNGRHEWTSPSTPTWSSDGTTEYFENRDASEQFMTPLSEVEEGSSEQFETNGSEMDDGIQSEQEENCLDEYTSQYDSESALENIPEDDDASAQQMSLGGTPDLICNCQRCYRGRDRAEDLIFDQPFHMTSVSGILMAKINEIESKVKSLEEAGKSKEETPSEQPYRRSLRKSLTTKSKQQHKLNPEEITKFTVRELKQATHNFHQSKEETPPEQPYRRSLRKSLTTKSEPHKLNPEEIIKFTVRELRQATHNFHPSKRIGQGGFGTVYIGWLDGIQVAIKKLNPSGKQGYYEFEQEVLILSSVKHPNIIKLLGVCSEEMALVYEYLSNGSLEGNYHKLPWQDRVRIIKEQHSAIVYLHSSTPYAIVHADVKLANILLDHRNISRLGDFGTARLLPQDPFGGDSTSRMTMPMGTTGTMDPVFFRTQRLTPQADAYSFGIMILQLLTGWQVMGITDRVEKSLDNGELQQILDPGAGNWPLPLTGQLLRLALSCCDCDEPKRRPGLSSDRWSVLDVLDLKAGKSIKLTM